MPQKIIARYTHSFSETEYLSSLVLSALAFVGSLFFNFYAIHFASEKASNSVTDIILSNIPVFEVDGLFVYGTLAFATFTIIILLMYPNRIPFGLYAVALFFIIRSIFSMLTHIAPFESTYVSDFGPLITSSFFGGDLFFSGHTGMPFLGALAYWQIKWARYTFLAGSAFFAVVVLLGHLHYSIDVLAAYFITYTIYQIAAKTFHKEHHWAHLF
ncbi:hypothetical protein KW798_00320 [Candidatus Parcubacteria bacterium]|nr:hypothetical protein [Candidatus Parcubacteria bacterium]